MIGEKNEGHLFQKTGIHEQNTQKTCNDCKDEKMKNKPLVSVIVPTFNSEKTLGLCLQSIKSQTYPDVETIVVDRYSMDGTLKVAEKFNARVLLMNSERSAAKNRGVANAKGSFILFLDSDAELTPNVIKKCVALCLQKDLDAIDIPEVSVAKGFLAECRKIEKAMYIGTGSFKMPRFFKKEAFLSVGGFDEKLVFGEDFDLCRRIETAGYKIGRVKAKIKHHVGELSMKRIVLKAYHYGKSLPSLVRKNPSFAMKAYCPTRFLRNLNLLRKYPIHFMSLVAIKLVEYITYSIGALSVTLSNL